MESETPKTEDAIVNLIRSQGRKGRAEYGKTTDRNDYPLDEWFDELQKELVDALIYSQRIRGGLQLLSEAREIIKEIKSNKANEWIQRHDDQFPI